MSTSNTEEILSNYGFGRRPGLGRYHEDLLESGFKLWAEINERHVDAPWRTSANILLDEMPAAERLALILADFDRQMFNNGFWGWVGNSHTYAMHYLFEIRDLLAKEECKVVPFTAKFSDAICHAIAAMKRNAQAPEKDLYLVFEGKRLPLSYDLVPSIEERSPMFEDLWQKPDWNESVGQSYRGMSMPERIEGMEALLAAAYPRNS